MLKMELSSISLLFLVLYFLTGPQIAYAKNNILELCPALGNWQTYQDEENQDYAMLIAGKDGWLFRSRLDLKFRFKLTSTTKDSFTRLNDAFNHQGTSLVIVMMPTRGITNHDKLIPPQSEKYKADLAYKNYLKMLSELRMTGMIVADMRDVQKINDYFLKDDNHWSANAAKFTAQRTAEAIKKLPVYDSLEKQEFKSVLIKETAKPPHRYLDFVNQICGTDYRGEPLTSRYETESVQQADTEDALFTDESAPQVTLLGTSNSTHPEPSYANFYGFLREYLQTDVLNEAVSGGSLQGSISNYLLNGTYQKTKPKVIVWEMNAYYGYNRHDFLREIVPSVYGECTADEALETAEGKVNELKTTIFDHLADKKYSTHKYYLVLKMDDKSQRKIKLRFTHGKKEDSIKVNRSLRSFPENPGIFFAELSDTMETPLSRIELETKKGSGNFEAKICQIPNNVKSTAITDLNDLKSAAPKETLFKRVASHVKNTFTALNPMTYDVRKISVTSEPDQPPPLPDISGFTREAIIQKIPPPSQGEVVVDNMEGAAPLRKFAFDKRLAEFQDIQERIEPEAIHIHSGTYRFEDMVSRLNNPDILEETDQAYILRMPIAVYPGASLVISGLLKPLLLSQDKGAFIVTAGKLFIIDTTIAGWNEKTGKLAGLNEKYTNFRPFITAWDGSEFYASGSEFKNLGYALSKSYGITISTNDVVQEEFEPRYGDLEPPTGWIVDSSFDQLYFGFYSYETENFVLLRNHYTNSLIYGIDPHDRSEGLIIAYNHVKGSKNKHGIILSREVNNSFVFNNETTHNRGSGIMLDRNCRNTVIANNISSHNTGDGITIYESPDNVLYDNKVTHNEGSGIRVRNSWNIRITGGENKSNKKFAFTVYEDPLTHTERDFEMDPVTTRAAMSVKNMTLVNNGGVVKAGGIDSLKLEGIDLSNASIKKPLFGGDLRSNEQRIRKYLTESKGVEIR